MQTTILFKTDKRIKAAAQKTAKQMGIPFSAVLNRLMLDFIEKREITFSSPGLEPTPYLKRLLIQGEKDLAAGKVKTYASLDELVASLDD